MIDRPRILRQKEPASGPLLPDTPSIELSRVGEMGGRLPSLSELSSDIKSLSLSVRISSDVGEPDEVRKRIHHLLDKFDREGGPAGFRTEQIADAKFALVALVDETVFNSDWPGKSSWRTLSLQQELYKMNVAGEEFFTRMDKLRGNMKENHRVLEVYFDCLALGFEGRYKLFGREKLDALIAEFTKELAQGREWSMKKLSPHWERPDDFAEAVGEGIPMWLTALFFIPGAAVLVLVFFLLARGSADSTAETMRNLLKTIGS